MRRALASGIALLWPSVGQACAVCGSVGDGSKAAFLISTIAMSLLPLGMFAGGLLWLRRRARQHAARAQEAAGTAREPQAGGEVALGR